MAECPRCGKPVDAEVKFCPSCGAQVTSSAEAKPAADARSRPRRKRRKTGLWLIAVIVLIVVGFVVQQNTRPRTSGLQPDAPWPMFGGDVAHTGQSSNLGPSIPTLEWRLETQGMPAIAADGTIYVGSVQSPWCLYALGAEGTIKWRFRVDGAVESSPAIGADGIVYVGSNDRHVYAIKPDGTLKWRYRTGARVASSPAIGRDGTVYVGSSDWRLYALRQDGTLKWKYKTGGVVHSSPAIGKDGRIYVGSWDDYLYAINPDGTLEWRYKTGGGVPSSPALGTDGVIHIGSQDGYLYAISPDGTLKWKYRTRSSVYTSPAIGKDGTIYIGSGELYAISAQGTLKWSHSNGWVDSSVAVDGDGIVYAGSDAGVVFAVGSDGSLRWRHDVRHVADGSIAVGKNGRIYVGSSYGWLYAIGERDANRLSQAGRSAEAPGLSKTTEEPTVRKLGDSRVVGASSVEPSADSRYDPQNLLDGRLQTAWGAKSGRAVGEWIRIGFPSTREVHKVGVVPGYAKYHSDPRYGYLFPKNNRVRDAELEFSDGTTVSAHFEDKGEMQYVELPQPVRCEWVKLTIRSVYRGSKYNDTCISEIEVWGL